MSSAVSAEVNGSEGAAATTAEETVTPTPNIRLNVNEKARTVTSVCKSGTLCTVSGHDGIAGAPFGSYVDYVLDDDGNPVLLMNDMSMHTINIRENAMRSDDATSGTSMVTLFTQLAGTGQDVSRCSVTGTIVKIDPKTAEDMDAIRMRYSIAHAYADQVMDSPKFDFYRLVPNKIYFVGGFGVLAKWVEPEDYKDSTPDILAQEAPSIVARINREHAEDLRLTANQLLDVEEEKIVKVRVTSVDRLGMDIRVTCQKGARRNKLSTDEFRVGFRIPVISVEDAKSEILKVFQEAWEKGNGYVWETDDELPGDDIPIAKIAEDSLE
jgi:putative heme iron utilization protein